MKNTESAGSSKRGESVESIKFVVSNSEYEDAAYAMFQGGQGLSKIGHVNKEAQMLYINSGDEDYAIANMPEGTCEFSLNFKAATMGKYRLSAEAKGMFGYIHLIDKKTGENVDMLVEDEYIFISSPTDSEDRFIVRLSSSPSNGMDYEMFAYQIGNEIVVSGVGTLQMYDMTGRLLKEDRMNGFYKINTSDMVKGAYVLRVLGDSVKTQKIVVK
ncbi:MAG: T9SS type A sorting domain-containing protein [Candidatus Limimorpha sp.]